MAIFPPQYALDVLRRLERSGYRAYFVGGCVRDMLLGRRPQDWDVCTQALPEDVLRVFPRSEPTGLKHGTVTVHSRKKSIEVTTFRREGAYLDHRRPERVCFVSDLRQDLQRRDFTMNAIARSLDGTWIDPFGGRADVAAGIVRCVGKAQSRFEEDALRMFRALRFSAKLGFAIEPETMQAIRCCAPLAEELAAERVHDELEKMLRSDRPVLLETVIECGLLDSYTRRAEPAVPLRRLAALPRTQLARWSGFCAVLVKSGAIDGVETFLTQLRLSGSVKRSCAAGVQAALETPPQDALGWKKLLSRAGEDTAYCAAAALEMLCRMPAMRMLRAVLASGECRSVQQLAVNGGDLLELGLRGAAVGAALHKLLDHVLEHPNDNQRDILLNLV